jgi:hypothetical protein
VIRYAYKVLAGKLEGRYYLRKVHIGERKLLEFTKENRVKVWAGLN